MGCNAHDQTRPEYVPAKKKYYQPCMMCCHCFPPGSPHVLEYLDLFHRAISPLNQYNIVFMGDLVCASIGIKFTNMVSMFSGVIGDALKSTLKSDSYFVPFMCITLNEWFIDGLILRLWQKETNSTVSNEK